MGGWRAGGRQAWAGRTRVRCWRGSWRPAPRGAEQECRGPPWKTGPVTPVTGDELTQGSPVSTERLPAARGPSEAPGLAAGPTGQRAEATRADGNRGFTGTCSHACPQRWVSPQRGPCPRPGGCRRARGPGQATGGGRCAQGAGAALWSRRHYLPAEEQDCGLHPPEGLGVALSPEGEEGRSVRPTGGWGPSETPRLQPTSHPNNTDPPL